MPPYLDRLAPRKPPNGEMNRQTPSCIIKGILSGGGAPQDGRLRMAPAERAIASSDWPDLLFSVWAETCATLHLWMQIVGKVRLAHAPMVNHWWQVPFYLACRGLTTGSMPL